MNGMAICAGVAGIELGLSLAEPGYRTICYIEREAYAVAVLRKRMEEKLLDEAPIWDDVKTFMGLAWRGKVDIITAGFPCQPWSAAGQRKGTEDERWIWPDIARVISEVRPRYVFLENVPGLFAWSDTECTTGPEEIKEGVDLGGDRRRVADEVEQRQGVAGILGDLTKIGYDAEWMHLSAAAVGAPHKRERVWILAHATSEREGRLSEGQGAEREGEADPIRGGQDVENPISQRWRGGHNGIPGGKDRTLQTEGPSDMANPHGAGLKTGGPALPQGWQEEDPVSGGPGEPKTGNGWWAVEPSMGRVVDGMAYRVDRIRACGNGVVSLVAAVAHRILKNRIGGI